MTRSFISVLSLSSTTADKVNILRMKASALSEDTQFAKPA
jgi:hypothetical protein